MSATWLDDVPAPDPGEIERSAGTELGAGDAFREADQENGSKLKTLVSAARETARFAPVSLPSFTLEFYEDEQGNEPVLPWACSAKAARNWRRHVRDSPVRGAACGRHQFRQGARWRHLRIPVGPGCRASTGAKGKAGEPGSCRDGEDPPSGLLSRARRQDRPSPRRIRQRRTVKRATPTGTDRAGARPPQSLEGSTERVGGGVDDIGFTQYHACSRVRDWGPSSQTSWLS